MVLTVHWPNQNWKMQSAAVLKFETPLTGDTASIITQKVI